MKFDETTQEKTRDEQRADFLEKIEPVKIADDFPMFVNRQDLMRYLVRYELFQKVLDIKGSIVECGVYRGASLMLFAQLSAIYEPYAFNREIIGFDAFDRGFPHIDTKDGSCAAVGDLANVDIGVLEKCIEFYDRNRMLNHIPKIKIVKGDAVDTIPKFFKDNPHTLVALLYLDFDLYMPTKIAMETIIPRMPKGSIIVFDELNEKRWQGETTAVLEYININKWEIKKFPQEPHIAWVRL